MLVPPNHAGPRVGDIYAGLRPHPRSRVVLSFGIPFAVLTGSPAVMGGDTNHRATTGWLRDG